MKVLYILPDGVSPTVPQDMLAEHGVPSISIKPSFLSAFTSMKVAKEVDKHLPQIVHAFRLKDAMAAISARSLCKAPYKIVVEAKANDQVPRSIPSDLRSGVDAWIFQSERLKDLYPQDMKRTVVIPTAPEKLDFETLLPDKERPNNAWLWVGPINGNASRLKSAINAVGNTPGATLTVCGTGNATETMPAVKLGRAVNSMLGREAVTWLGDSYDLREQASRASAVAQSGLDPIPVELALSLMNLPIIDVSNPESSMATVNTTQETALALANFYKSL